MRILYMGTPEIAAGILRALAARHEVCGVFCQPDKPVGRKAAITPPPVKVAAGELGIPVFQPVKMRDGQAADQVRALAPEMIVVVAYGRILPREILEIPLRGCLNVHVSLLPQYRGAAPIQHALLNGERETGVTVMRMDEGMDTGDILRARALPISDEDDAETLFARAETEGAALLLEVLEELKDGEIPAQKQEETAATFAPPLRAEMAPFMFSSDATEIVNKVRALCLWPGAHFVRGEKKIKVLRAARAAGDAPPGTVLSLDPLTVAAGSGAVALLAVQPQGGRRMTGREYAMGLRLKPGDKLV